MGLRDVGIKVYDRYLILKRSRPNNRCFSRLNILCHKSYNDQTTPGHLNRF